MYFKMYLTKALMKTVSAHWLIMSCFFLSPIWDKNGSCNTLIPDKRLTSNCIEILKHVIEVFVFVHNRARGTSQVKGEDGAFSSSTV